MVLVEPTQRKGWQVGDQSIETAKFIKLIKGGVPLYAVLGLEYENDPVWITALEMVYASRGKGQQGVKFENGMFKLKNLSKEMGDLRLYSYDKFINPDNQALLIFNECGDHTDIENLTVHGFEYNDVYCDYAVEIVGEPLQG